MYAISLGIVQQWTPRTTLRATSTTSQRLCNLQLAADPPYVNSKGREHAIRVLHTCVYGFTKHQP